MQYEIIPLKDPITAKVDIPGSKSYTNRALILGALTKGEVRIKSPLTSDDTEAMIGCLQSLGVKVIQEANEIFIKSDISEIQNKTYKLNAKLSGTTIRFILALACIVPGTKVLEADEGLKKRPIKNLVEALRQLGADIEYLENDGYPPLKINSSELNSGEVNIDGGVSSQFISALLMISPIVGLIINIREELISKPYIDMTLDVMEKFGVSIINENYQKFIVEKQEYSINEYTVEGDYSAATYFAAIAVLTNSTIKLRNLNPNSKQADKKFLEILENMGNEVIYGEDEVIIVGKNIKPVEINMKDFPDSAQTMAVLLSFVNGTSKLSEIKSLRVKETERVKALENELGKMGIKTESTKDSLTVHGGNPSPAVINTYNDHRMAMSFAVAGSKIEGIKIDNPEVVNKTFPNFWEKLHSIGVQTKEIE